MRVESTFVMYEAFQSCRHMQSRAASDVRTLISVLNAVREQDCLVVYVPDDTLGSLVKLGRDDPTGARLPPDARDARIPSQVLAAIDVCAPELARLISAGATMAVRRLGYAFHVLPNLVRFPEMFSPSCFAHNFALAAGHWNELSLPMRDALRALVGQRRAELILSCQPRQ